MTRVFATSDIHVDFKENYDWVVGLSFYEYQNDILILAGDVTDVAALFEEALSNLRNKFMEVIFVPGNHDLWVRRNLVRHSLEKYALIKTIANDCGVLMRAYHCPEMTIVPLLGWYDYSFCQPTRELLETWTDYVACIWPPESDENSVTQYFIGLNEPVTTNRDKNRFTITASHFLPRIDLMPSFIPLCKRIIYPVLGTSLLEDQIRQVGSDLHVYGHSHVNSRIVKDSVLYINNAFGYPREDNISAKILECVFEF